MRVRLRGFSRNRSLRPWWHSKPAALGQGRQGGPGGALRSRNPQSSAEACAWPSRSRLCAGAARQTALAPWNVLSFTRIRCTEQFRCCAAAQSLRRAVAWLSSLWKPRGSVPVPGVSLRARWRSPYRQMGLRRVPRLRFWCAAPRAGAVGRGGSWARGFGCGGVAHLNAQL